MKYKQKLIAAAALFASSFISNGATVIITNATNGGGSPPGVPADTLYALRDNSLMVGGTVVAGYFPAITTSTDIDTIPELFSLLGSFTPITSISPGIGAVDSLDGGIYAGYADQFPNAFSLGTVNSGNILFNRDIYAIVTDAATLGSATSNSQFGLIFVGKLTGDNVAEIALSVNPSSSSGALIGSFDTKTGDFAGTFSTPTSVFSTYKLDVVPEPSTALIAALGTLALLRRRRI